MEAVPRVAGLPRKAMVRPRASPPKQAETIKKSPADGRALFENGFGRLASFRLRSAFSTPHNRKLGRLPRDSEAVRPDVEPSVADPCLGADGKQGNPPAARHKKSPANRRALRWNDSGRLASFRLQKSVPHSSHPDKIKVGEGLGRFRGSAVQLTAGTGQAHFTPEKESPAGQWCDRAGPAAAPGRCPCRRRGIDPPPGV